MEKLRNFFYCSTLAPEFNPSVIAEIVKSSRKLNKENSITGILIFDGVRFFHYIEGPFDKVTKLIRSISKDCRHIDFTPKLSNYDLSKRLFTDWSMAYVLVDDSEPLDEITNADGTVMLDKLHKLLPILDSV